eukprot:scaffold1069_cov155-Amphora_coffeaeformis.AAC.5
MQRDETDPKKTKVHIRFNRQIVKHGGASLVLNSVRNSLSQPEWNVFHKNNLTMVDGPLASQATEFSPLAALCTSGGGSRVTSDLRATAKGQGTKKIGTTNIVLSAWTNEQQKDALIACLHLREEDSTESDEEAKEPDSHKTGGAARGVSLDGQGAPMVLDYHQEVFDEDRFDEDRFDEVYFCTGGRIRDMMALYTNPSILDDFKSDIVTDIDRISKSQAKVALARADERSTSVHVDAVRSLYRREKPGEKKKYSKDALYQKIDGDEYFQSYTLAKNRGHKGTEAEYFEELMHWVFSKKDQFDCIKGVIRADPSLTGAEGVKELTEKNKYWIPSIPNFVNIDAAIVDADGHVW